MTAQPSPGRRPRRVRRLVVALVAVVVASCVGVVVLIAPPGSPPDYPDPRPPIRDDGYVSLTREVTIAATPEQVVAWLNAPDRDLADLVQFEDFPAVVGTEPLIGDWVPGSRVGDRRRVEFADGHYLAEEVLVDEPSLFRYQIWGFTAPQRFAVRHGVAEFRYLAAAGGTRVVWTYRMLPTMAAVRPAVRSFLDATMGPMMRASLDAMRDGIQADTR